MTVDNLVSADVVTGGWPPGARQRDGERRPVLGAARRRRQLRRRHPLRVSAPSGRPERVERPRRLSVQRGEVRARRSSRGSPRRCRTSSTCGWSRARRRRCRSCPRKSHGKEIVALAVCYAGDPAEGEKLIAPLRTFGTADRRARRRAALHRLAAGVRSAAGAGRAQLLEVAQLLGAERRRHRRDRRVRRQAALAALRDLHRHGRRPDHSRGTGRHGLLEPRRQLRDERARPLGNGGRGRRAGIAWAREFFAKSKPFASGGAYINFLTQDETDRVEFAYGAGYKRLVEIKKKYDPANFFRMNQNIKPVTAL